jgi:Tol biopolymer transport system component
MKRIFFLTLLLSLALAGCMPPAAIPVSSTTSTATVEPTVEVLPVEPDGGIGDTPTQAPVEQPSSSPTPAEHIVALVALDGNIMLVNAASGEKKAVTSDAASFSSSNATPVVIYQNPKWSSDGLYLAFDRQIGTPHPEGYSFAYALLVYDYTSGETRTAVDGQQTAGFAWKPGSHLLSFALATQPGYFVTRGGVDASLATGISAVDVDSMSGSRLVAPEGGYSLVNPNWSPDGQTLSFEELLYMEGRGNFAFYDFAAGKYVAWGKAIGSVSWFTDGSKLLHDNLNYTPTYTERIFEIKRDGSGELRLSPEAENSYAYDPHYSPDGRQIAYIQVSGMDPDVSNELVLIDSSGTTRPLTQLSQVYNLTWTPDGRNLLLATGNYPDLQTVLISLEDGAQTPISDGWQAVMRP